MDKCNHQWIYNVSSKQYIYITIKLSIVLSCLTFMELGQSMLIGSLNIPVYFKHNVKLEILVGVQVKDYIKIFTGV